MSAARQRYSVFRDPVHGDVYLSHEEVALLDTAEMQRLRGVKQLGAAHLVYPGAVHTRFEHSIGTLAQTERVIEAIRRNYELDPRELVGVSEAEARILRAAALVHDATHIPFGHNIEDQTGLVARHDTRARYQRLLGPSTELGRALAELGLAADVIAILTAGEDGGALPIDRADERRGSEHALPAFWSQVLADTIGADLLDYLARDAYFTGLRLQTDPRIASYFKVERASGKLFIDLAKRELLREDILSEIVRLLEARYYFSERVYYHHAKVAAGAMLARAVELCLVGGALREEELYDLTDASLVALLQARAAQFRGEEGRRAAALARAFGSRRLHKRACVFTRQANERVQTELVERFFARGRHAARAEVEARIADLVRFATGRAVDVIVYCPAAKMQLKEARTHVRWPGTGEVRPLSEYAERVPRLADLERSYRDLWKFYVFADTGDRDVLRKVQEVAAAEFPGAVNAYRVE